MAQTTVQIPVASTSASLNYIRMSSQPQVDERRGRYAGPSAQQPDQNLLRCNEPVQVDSRGGYNLAEVNQGLKELQEKLNNTLKRSTSAAHSRSSQNTASMVKMPAFGQAIQPEYQTENTERTVATNSSHQLRTDNSPVPSYPSAVKYIPANISSPMVARNFFEGFHLQSPQVPSSKFYLGDLNPNLGNQEERLNSIKNYQVKTIHMVHSNIGPQQQLLNYTQQPQYFRLDQSLGSSSILSMSSPHISEGFQPGYDRQRFVVSNIARPHQSFIGVRQDSFASTIKLADLTGQDSLLMSKVYEQNIPQENTRQPPQHLRPAKKSQLISKKEQRPAFVVIENKKQPKTNKGSNCGEFTADGDSMIMEFIKQKDRAQDFGQEESRPAKRVREVEEDEPMIKKPSRRQEILSSKRQVKGNDQPKTSRKDSNAKSQSGEAPQKSRRRN